MCIQFCSWLGGLKIIKHPRRGSPAVKRLHLNQSMSQLTWDGRHGNGLALSDIYEVRKGMTTSVFQRTGRVNHSINHVYLRIWFISRT
jgi:hypothetical protein